MGPTPTISLEQWRALVAVVDEGGYAAAAEAIHKSQSAVTYAVQRVEKLLGVKAFRLGWCITMKEVRKHRNLIVRDTSVKRDKGGGFLEAEQRWTVGDMATSLQAARMGFGFAWYPEEKIREEIAAGEMKVLPLEDGGDAFGDIYLVLADPEGAGPGVRRLAEILKQDVRSQCTRRPRKGAP